MCGRFNVIDSPGLRQLLQDLGVDLALAAAVNVAPTEQVALVRGASGSRELSSARWWLTPAWAPEVSQKYAMFNARCETLASSRAFRGPFRRQRGLVPMSGFIEWRQEAGGRQPWLVSNPEQALAVAALWDIWEGGAEPLLSCTLVTTAAAPAFQPWHRRMPVLLAEREREQWLDCSRAVPADDPLFRAELKTDLLLTPLSPAVNNARHKDPAGMVAIGDSVELAA